MQMAPEAPVERDRKDLKIQALLEKVSSLTTRYENEIADLRVELTMQHEEAKQRINDLTGELVGLRNAQEQGTQEVVEGEVVSEDDADTDDTD